MAHQARLGDKSRSMADDHGCPACPHVVEGPAVQASPNVYVNFRHALRKNDKGIHKSCCGPGVWVATHGCATVLINHQYAVRQGDETEHCGGTGSVIEGSADVLVGED